MIEPRRTDPAAAGAMLVATIVSCAGAGFGIGALIGFPVPLGLVGLFVGLIAGFALVYARFKRV
jgi:hypothetical protein